MDASPDLLAHLTGTAAVDAEGRPLVLHHGTFARFDRFGETRDIGYHFGTRAQAAAREEEARERHRPGRGARWRAVSVALAVRNPLLLHEDPRAWPTPYVAMLCAHALSAGQRRLALDADREQLAAARAAFEAASLAQGRAMRAGERLWRDLWERANARSLAVLRGALEDNGHDGIIYPNRHEGGRGAPSWVAFRPESVIILGEGLDADRLSVKPAVAVDADYAPGTNPTLLPRDPAARPPGRERLSRARFAALAEALDGAALGLGSSRARECGDAGAWDVPTAAGTLRIRADDLGRVSAVLQGRTREEQEELCAALSGFDDRLETAASPSGWTFRWRVGETPASVAARLADLIAALPGPEAAPAAMGP